MALRHWGKEQGASEHCICQRKKNARRGFGMLSIIILVHNELFLIVYLGWDAEITSFRRRHLGRRPLPNTLLRTLLTSYASHALTSLLLPTLHHHLPHAASSLPSLLTQLTYCAAAFARVGLDFRGVLGCSSGNTRCGCEVVRCSVRSKR